MPVVTLSSKGQIVLPRGIRRSLNLCKDDRLYVTREGDRIVLTPYAKVPLSESWQRWRGRLAGTQAAIPHHRGRRKVDMSVRHVIHPPGQPVERGSTPA